MKNEPRIEKRPEQLYIGTRAVMPMSAFDSEIPAMMAKVSEWLGANRLQPSGKPFLRYHVIDMPKRMDVELGFPVKDAPAAAAGEVQKNVLPAGRYAVLTYKNVKGGVPANKQLIDWIAANSEEAVSHEAGNGEAFKARYETYLTDPKTEPDQEKWSIEVAIKVRD